MNKADARILGVIEKLRSKGKILSRASKEHLEEYIQSIPKIHEIGYDLTIIEKILTTKSPFIYLNSEERELIKSTSKFIEINGQNQEVMGKGANDYHMMLILEGEVVAVDLKTNYCETLEEGDSFGADGCLFGNIRYSIITATISTKIMKIPTSTFFQLLNCEKQFTMILGRNMLYKQKVFSALENFMSFIIDGANIGYIDLEKLVLIYRKIRPALHPLLNSPNLDISAWKYAIERLPENLTNTFVYHLTTCLPDMLLDDDRTVEINSKSRKRNIYRTVLGKDVIVLRDMESDLGDILSNLCVHYIESKKLRKKLKFPHILHTLIETEALETLPLTADEIEGVRGIWNSKVIDNIRNIILHHEDYRIIVTSTAANLRSGPSELWTETLWKGCQKALGTDLSIKEAMKKGLVIDVVQGSTRTLLNQISPYYKSHSTKVMKWFERSEIKLKTTEFFKDTDKLFAAAYYYLKKFPEQEEVKKQMESDSGIVQIEETEMTGVKVLIVNVQKLKSKDIRSKSSMHLIINIGYTFGKQGFDIIKCFNLLFDTCIDSFSFIGKAGGLLGKRKDILISTKFHDMSTKGVTLVNPTGISSKMFEDLGISVHKGPMLTVAGTILQNSELLTYYKHIEGCVGLEMEGCYFAQAIQQGIEQSLLKENIPTRFIYYVSDLPLHAESNLAQEGDNVSWDEGVPTMNAITEQCLKLCGETSHVKIKDRIRTFIEKCPKFAIVHKQWKIAQELLNAGWAVVAFVSSQELIPRLVGEYITVDYTEDFEYFLKIEKILVDERNDGKMLPLVVLHDPTDISFWVPAKVEHNSKIRFHTTKVIKSYKHFSGGNTVVFIEDTLVEKSFDGVNLVVRETSGGIFDVRKQCILTVEEICAILMNR